MDVPRDERPLGQLFADLSRQLTTLVRQEIALARAEVIGGVREMSQGAALAGLGAVLIHGALLVLLAAIVLALIGAHVAPWLAALIVAVTVGAVGAVFVQVGRTRLAQADLAPRRTVETLQDDAEWAKEQLP